MTARHRSLVIGIGVAAGATIAACGGGSAEPGNLLSGTYVLRLVNGSGLPVVYDSFFSQAIGAWIYRSISGGELEFGRYARALEVMQLSNEIVSGDTTIISYRLEGQRIVLTRPAVPGRAAYDDTGTVDELGITFVMHHMPDKSNANLEMVYQAPSGPTARRAPTEP